MSVKKRSIGRLLSDHGLVEAALKKGTEAALRQHKQAGLPVVVWRDGKVTWVPPEEFPPLQTVAKSSGQRRRK